MPRGRTARPTPRSTTLSAADAAETERAPAGDDAPLVFALPPGAAAMVRAIRRAIERGEIPPDTDPDIIVDLINGAGYYQLVVRPDDGGGTARLHAAIDLLV